jgi:fatty-acyl-CoA synthase
MNASDQGAVEKAVATLPDVEALERAPLGERNLAASTYEMLRRGAAIAPRSPTLSFFLRMSEFDKPFVWTHAEFFADITRAANALRRLGIGRTDVVAFVLPNLPEAHFVIWGGEAAGIAFAINPLQDAKQIGELLEAGKAKWLVTLAPAPGSDFWEKSVAAAAHVPTLKGTLTVGLGPYLRGPAGFAARAMAKLRRPSLPVLKSLTVGLDPKRGLLARLSTDGNGEVLREALGRYTFQVEIN